MHFSPMTKLHLGKATPVGFLRLLLTLHLFCKLWYKDKITKLCLGYCRKVMAQYGCLYASGPAFFVNINAYYSKMKT